MPYCFGDWLRKYLAHASFCIGSESMSDSWTLTGRNLWKTFFCLHCLCERCLKETLLVLDAVFYVVNELFVKEGHCAMYY